MPPNSVVKNSILVGGLTVLGYVAGGKLGSMLGKLIYNFIPVHLISTWYKILENN